MTRRLYRCDDDRRLAGVAAGVAEYFDIDVTLVRVIWFVSIFFGGFGLLLYLVMALVVPLEPVPAVSGMDPVASSPSGHHHAGVARSGSGVATILGIALVLFGSLALLDAVLPDRSNGGRFVGPAFILGLGLVLLVTAARRGAHAP
jgi:phage shock protein PspC (stress-responsive transcriptional regulator)